jgi:hypothetical protein
MVMALMYQVLPREGCNRGKMKLLAGNQNYGSNCPPQFQAVVSFAPKRIWKVSILVINECSHFEII